MLTKRESKRTDAGIRGRGIDPEAVALAAFGRIVAEPDRLERFLALSGLAPDTIRKAAAEPGFCGAILDHLVSDEGLLIAVAEEIGHRPEEIMRARGQLSPDSVFDP